jgi:hypothetical protein
MDPNMRPHLHAMAMPPPQARWNGARPKAADVVMDSANDDLLESLDYFPDGSRTAQPPLRTTAQGTIPRGGTGPHRPPYIKYNSFANY